MSLYTSVNTMCLCPDLLYKTTIQEVLVDVVNASLPGSELHVRRDDSRPNIVCKVSKLGSELNVMTAGPTSCVR